MPEAISQYRPTWLEKIRNAITEAVKYGHMKNVNAYENEQRMLTIAKNIEAERIIRPAAGPRILPAFKR